VFGDLPDQVEFMQSGISVPGYPAIIDQDDTVAVRILDNEVEANRLGEAGVLRLFMLNLREQRKYIEKNFPEFPRFAIYFAARRRKDAGKDELLSDLVHAVFRYTFIEDKPAVKSKAMFTARLAEKQHLMTNANRAGDLMVRILEHNHRIEQVLDETRTETTKYACDDIRQQLDRLLGDHFVARTPIAWLSQFPRYLAAIEYRLGKMQGNLIRDKENTAEVNRFEERYFALDVIRQDMVMRYRFMLEEFRVSLFAQPLGTSGPVSARRLEKLWQDLL
jgi:ATP-dependent helicase HrpA